MKTTNEQTGELGALEALVVDNPDLERLEVLLGQFNIFEALRAVRQEARHSAFLAYLLDATQNHGLGDAFPRRLLQKALASANTSPVPLSPVDLDVWSLNELVVLREWHSIDILLLDEPHHLAVIIENKIDSSEHSDQLRRYLELVKQYFPEWNILGLYLSPEGDAPSHEAYIPIDYLAVCETVERLIESRSSTVSGDVRILMAHYAQMLRRHIVAESEIAELCRRIYRKHQRALDLIYEYRPDQQASIRQTLEELVQKSEGLTLDHSSKSYVLFAPTGWDKSAELKSGGGWTPSGRILLFEFLNSPDRLLLRLYIGPGPVATRQRLFEMAKAHPSPFRLASKSLGQKWNSIYSGTFLTSKDYEDATDEQLAEEIGKHWKNFVDHVLPAISDVLRQEHWLWQPVEDQISGS
jgi:PD-(D/E)XK nuclease superfamily